MVFHLHLFTGENQALLLRWNAFLLLNSLFDAVYFICWLDVNLNLLASQCLFSKKIE